ncbi:MAG: hypothetical protein BBJ60_00140 [Desulfobacterales bacterium S7086C20]|nr:MAG: hypothetical protein BBJ60_00140 [Desulfobacterales bacterium S7086C20]
MPFCRLKVSLGKSLTSVILINQICVKIWVMFGNPEATPGGNALKFYSSVRLDGLFTKSSRLVRNF